MSSHEQNPTLGQHIKMLGACLTTAIVLAASIAIGFGQAYELVKWIGSR